MALSGWLRRLQEIYSRLGAPAGASVSADLAALQADLGNPSARANLLTIEAMLGNPDAAAASLDGIIRTGYATSAITRNVDGSVLERLEALLQKLPLLMPSLVEFWDSAAIGANWATAVTGTGGAAYNADATNRYVALTLPANLDTARLRAVRLYIGPTYGTLTIARRLIVEWEAQLQGAVAPKAAMDNTRFLMGLGSVIGSDASSQRIMAFILTGAGNDLTARTIDVAAATDTNVNASYPGDNVWGKYRIEVLSLTSVRFYINDVLVATHTASISSFQVYLSLYGAAGNANAPALRIGPVRTWYDDEPYV